MCALLTGVQTCALPIFASAFGSVYAAYGLYDLLAPLIAFLLLALVAFAAFALALLHGPFIAVLALLGGFLTPLLVTSPEPSAWGLFAYLLALSGAALAVTRYTACRSEEHTSELQSLMRISYAVFCLKKKKKKTE